MLRLYSERLKGGGGFRRKRAIEKSIFRVSGCKLTGVFDVEITIRFSFLFAHVARWEGIHRVYSVRTFRVYASDGLIEIIYPSSFSLWPVEFAANVRETSRVKAREKQPVYVLLRAFAGHRKRPRRDVQIDRMTRAFFLFFF